MEEFRTRSLLLSIVETSAELISECGKAFKIGNLLDPLASTHEQAGLDSFGINAALPVLLRAVKEEAALSAFGSIVTRWDIAQRLANLRRFCDEESKNPKIVEESIEAPIIITGLPRSGTTFL